MHQAVQAVGRPSDRPNGNHFGMNWSSKCDTTRLPAIVSDTAPASNAGARTRTRDNVTSSNWLSRSDRAASSRAQLHKAVLQIGHFDRRQHGSHRLPSRIPQKIGQAAAMKSARSRPHDRHSLCASACPKAAQVSKAKAEAIAVDDDATPYFYLTQGKELAATLSRGRPPIRFLCALRHHAFVYPHWS